MVTTLALDRMMTESGLPKSYLTDEERAELVSLDVDSLYAVESSAADDAGDEETAWAWLKLAEIPAHTLMVLKKTMGAEKIRELGLRTETAEKVYGKDWLDK